jgi:hypothetical protein
MSKACSQFCFPTEASSHVRRNKNLLENSNPGVVAAAGIGKFKHREVERDENSDDTGAGSGWWGVFASPSGV